MVTAEDPCPRLACCPRKAIFFGLVAAVAIPWLAFAAFLLTRYAQTERFRFERGRCPDRPLNHRVKNTLATVQSIALQTLRSAAVMEAPIRPRTELVETAAAE